MGNMLSDGIRTYTADRNRDLQNYSNGDFVHYAYDTYGWGTTQTWEDITTVSCEADVTKYVKDTGKDLADQQVSMPNGLYKTK